MTRLRGFLHRHSHVIVYVLLAVGLGVMLFQERDQDARQDSFARQLDTEIATNRAERIRADEESVRQRTALCNTVTETRLLLRQLTLVATEPNEDPVENARRARVRADLLRLIKAPRQCGAPTPSPSGGPP